MIAKFKWHPGELYPRVGFIITNLSCSAERVVAFYNKREQWNQIRQGCDKLDAAVLPNVATNAVRLAASCARL